MLGDLAWRQGRRDQAYEHLDRAVELLKERPASPSKAWVLSEVSRYHMLGGRYREAIDVGGEALGMAEEFGMAEVKAHALNNIGTARASVGDLGGIDDLKRSIEIAAAAHSVEELRGRNNLASTFLGLGDFHQALEAWIPGIELAEQYRGVPNAEWILSQRLTIAFATGNWNDFLRLMDDFLLQGGLTEYQAAHFHGMRSRIRLARGDLPKATEDAEFALAIDRGAKDPQRLLPGLGVSALVLLHAGPDRGMHRTRERTDAA